jgi:hypothetical protein
MPSLENYTKEEQDIDKAEVRKKWDFAIASGCKYIVLRERKDYPGMGELRLALTSKDEYVLQEGEIFKEIQGA